MIFIRRRLAVLLLTAVCLFSSPAIWAEAVSPEQVRAAAEGFLQRRDARTSKSQPWLATSRTNPVLIPALDGNARAIRDRDGTILAYAVELEPQGFIITSADTDLAPIVAYSFRGGFPEEVDVRHPFYCLLTADLHGRLAARRESAAQDVLRNHARWALSPESRMLADEGQTFQQWPAHDSTSTGGWLETTWEQGVPYNMFCPLDPVDGARTYAGCVATAMAQVLHYHRRGSAVFGPRDAYTTVNGIDIDGDHVRYDFPSLGELNEYLALVQLRYDAGIVLEEIDIAALNFAGGVAARMDYSSEGSGASAYDMRNGLVEDFGFFSADLADDLSAETARVLRENLANRQPAILGIHTPDGMSGHAVVCDGYNTDGEYHLNFGWGRSYPNSIGEAWYRLPIDIPASLNAISGVLVNIQPTAPEIEVSPLSLAFRSIPNQASSPQMLSLRNASGGALFVHSITCPEGFAVALPEGEYADHVGAFEIQNGGEAVAIRVRFTPASAGACYGMLAVQYGDGQVTYVPLDGAAPTGGTEIEAGEVSGTWSQARSPYYVLGDIRVARGGELIVEPGVQVAFMGPYSFTVGKDARLLAQGTPGRLVEFTAGHRERGWKGLRFTGSGDDDVLNHCSITFVKNGMETLISRTTFEVLPSGGAVCCCASSPTITHCKITNNTCARAGAVFGYESSAVIRNTLIANNACIGGEAQSGGICAYWDSAIRIENCTIVNNAPGGLFSESEYGTQVVNTIVWGNRNYQIQSYASEVVASFCDVQGGYEGRENIDAYPSFFEPTGGAGAAHDATAANWTLQLNSPCINGGSEAASDNTDLAGNDRVHSGRVDIGAYENQLALPLIGISPADRVDFGCVAVDANEAATLRISNTGELSFQISSLTLSDPRGVFAVADSVSPRTLSPGESVDVQIRFAPAAERIYSGSIHIVSTSSNASYRRIALRAVGGAGTLVPRGAVSGIWTKALSPYTVTGDIEIPAGQTLRVEPGVTVRFAGHFGLTAGRDATLHAVGTEDDPIRFTATDRLEGWFGIRFVDAGDDDVLRYCHLEHARKPYATSTGPPNLAGGAVACYRTSVLGAGGWPSGPVSSPTIDHCRFSDNHAESGGAIACWDGSQAVISNNTIVDNLADWEGGGIYVYDAAPTIANNILAANAAYWGGGLYSDYSRPRIINNTVVRNRPNGLHLGSTFPLTAPSDRGPACLLNNIVWDNEIYLDEALAVGGDDYDIRFNDIQGGWDGEGNLEADPLFADPARGDYHLKSAAGRWDPQTAGWVVDDATSPCIDAGTPASDPGQEPLSNGARINLGAYGGTSQASQSP